MKRILAIGALGLSLAGCAKIDAAVQKICAVEEREHIRYGTYVAPFRSTAAVQLELANYTMIHNACVAGDPFGVLFSLVRAASSLRS